MSISDYWIITKILDSALREGFTDKLSASTTIVDRYWLCLLLDLKRNHSEYDQLELFPLINPVKWINVLCFNKPTVPPTSLDWQNQYITCDVPKQWDSFMIQLFKTEECSPNTLHPWNDFAFYLNNPRVVIFSSVWHKSCSWCLINLKLTSNKLFLFFFNINFDHLMWLTDPPVGWRIDIILQFDYKSWSLLSDNKWGYMMSNLSYRIII